jgi:hypothetical protein
MKTKPLKGRDPIRGPLRWSDAEWSEVQAALAKSGRSYADVARKAILSAIRRLARTELPKNQQRKAKR